MRSRVMHDSLTLFPDPASRPPIPPVIIDSESGIHILEEGFPLDASSDVVLDEAGMTLWAKVSWNPGEYARSIPWYSGRMGVKSEMVFKCPRLDAGEVSVECIHLAVYAAPLDELTRYREISGEARDPLPVDLSETTKFLPLPIAPEEQFRAMRSYVEGIASVGVRALLDAGEQPGFNHAWHVQVSRAIDPILDECNPEKILPHENAVLFTLERLCGGQIPRVKDKGSVKFGYYVHDGHITHLGLEKHSLKSLPAAVGRLNFLRVLNLAQNVIESLPDEIGELTHLEELDLRTNRLTELPSEVGNLIKLKRLDLGDNKLTALPDTIGNLGNLQVLNLKWNLLKSLPETIGTIRFQLNACKCLA